MCEDVKSKIDFLYCFLSWEDVEEMEKIEDEKERLIKTSDIQKKRSYKKIRNENLVSEIINKNNLFIDTINR